MYDREILSLATLHEPKFTVRKKIPVENFIMKPLIHGNSLNGGISLADFKEPKQQQSIFAGYRL